MLLSADVLDYFKQKAGGQGYQTLINRTLPESMEWDSLLDAVRQAVREEMRQHYSYGPKKLEMTMTTSKKEASKASKVLSDKKSSKNDKSVAASDLSQAKKKKK